MCKAKIAEVLAKHRSSRCGCNSWSCHLELQICTGWALGDSAGVAAVVMPLARRSSCQMKSHGLGRQTCTDTAER
jgi:hypothetical protein